METKPQRRLLALSKKEHGWKSTPDPLILNPALFRLKKKSAIHWSTSHIFFCQLTLIIVAMSDQQTCHSFHKHLLNTYFLQDPRRHLSVNEALCHPAGLLI